MRMDELTGLWILWVIFCTGLWLVPVWADDFPADWPEGGGPP